MSVPALDGWFSPSIRRNRKSFILAIFGVFAVMIVAYLGVQFFAKTSSGGGMVLLAFYVPAVVCTYFLTAQRLRDLNITGWLALLWIPIEAADKALGGALFAFVAMLFLCSLPGTRGPNKYGPDPLAADLTSVFD